MEQSLGQNTPLSGCTFPARGMVRFRRWGEHVAMYVRSTTPYGEKMHRAQGKGKHTRPTLAVESTVQDRLITHAHTHKRSPFLYFISLISVHSFIHSFLQGFRRVWARLSRGFGTGWMYAWLCAPGFDAYYYFQVVVYDWTETEEWGWMAGRNSSRVTSSGMGCVHSVHV